MYISKLYIKNYRSIHKQIITFREGRNVLVGKNNSGKSNIVKALEFLLGEKYPTYRDIEQKDFYCYKKGKEKIVSDCFYICVQLSGNDINLEELKSIKGMSVAYIGSKNLLQECFETDRINNSLICNIDNFNSSQKRYYHNQELIDLLEDATELYFYIFISKNNDVELEDEKTEYNKTYSMFIKSSDQYYRCSKFPGELRDALLTSAILPAFRDPTNQLRINTWSWYGKLIRNIWDNDDSDRKKFIEDRLDEIKEKTDLMFNDAIVNIKENLEKAIYHNSISFQLMQNTSDDIYKGVNIFVDDGIESPICDKGSGIQSALIISLFSYYCSMFHKNSSLLVVEEPEIYLHPHARRVLSDKFDEFVTANSKVNNQVIVTTHSTEFIRNTPIENIIVVRKIANETQVSNIDTENKDIKEIEKIKNILWTKNAEIFFADKVILVEGGEEYLIPLVADNYTGSRRVLDYNNISVAKVGGKTLFKPYIELLKDLGIKYYVLADFDILHNGIEQLNSYINGYDSEDLNALKSALQKIIPKENIYDKSKSIKEKILAPQKSIDAKELCKILDQVCSMQEYDEKLGQIWSYLRPKVVKKVNYTLLAQNPDLRERVYKYIDKLKESNIFVLKKGELEDYITEEGETIAEELHLSLQKELKIIKLTEMIENKEKSIEEIFDLNEFEEFIAKVLDIKNENTKRLVAVES